MKHSFLITAALLALVSCGKKVPADFTELRSLAGTWVMTTENGTMIEKWEQVNDTLLTGSVFEISQGDSVQTETLQLFVAGDSIYYMPTVMDQNDGRSIRFKMTSRENGAFIFENTTHDFPTQISYEFQSDDRLKAVISGEVFGEMQSMDFEYTRSR